MKFNAGIDVPKGWQLIPLKRFAQFGYGETLVSEARGQGEIKVYGSNGPYDKHSKPNTLSPCIIIGRKGSHGKLNYSEEPVFATDTTFLLDRRHTLADLRFLYYLLSILGLDELSDDTAIPGLSRRKAYQALSPLPPLDTQRWIARFLDEKTARIDTMIEKKHALMNLLSEKRQSFITLAVTKGIDTVNSKQPENQKEIKQVKRVSSTSESALPKDWSSKRLKYIATYNDDVLTESTDEEKEIDYVQIAGVSILHGIEKIERITFGKAPTRARRKVRSGDILIPTVGTHLRAITRVDKASSDLIASTGFCVVRPSKNVDGKFLGWALQSELFVSEMVARSVGVCYPAINPDEIVTISMSLPPINTQWQIAQYLNEKVTLIDRLHELLVKSIDKLVEYRSALITAAVTGQLKELQ